MTGALISHLTSRGTLHQVTTPARALPHARALDRASPPPGRLRGGQRGSQLAGLEA